MTIGISKRALLDGFYPDELAAVFGEYVALHKVSGEEDAQEERMDPKEFLMGFA